MKKLLIATLIVVFCIKLTYAQRISPYQSGSYYPEKVVNRSGYNLKYRISNDE